MDLKALIAKMDHIESKQILNEGFPTVADAKARADKEKTTGKFDKKELSTGTQYTRKASTFDDGGKDKDQKKAEKKKKNESFSFKQGGIAHQLLSEFNLAEAPVANPYQGADAAKFAAMSPADQAHLTKGGQAPDINDEFILARAPNKGQPAAAPATGAASQPAAGASADGNAGEPEAQAAMAAAQQGVQVTPLGEPAANNSTTTTAQPSAAAPASGSPATAKPAAGAAAAPAAGSAYTIKPGDNLTKIAKANGTTVQAIMQANPQIKDANKIAAGASLTLPTAGQAAQPAQPAAGQAAQPAAGQAAQPAGASSAVPQELASVTDKKQPYWVNGTRYTWSAPFRGRPARWAASTNRFGGTATRQKISTKYTGPDSEFGKQPAAPLTQSIQHEDDAILERIRTALFR